MEQQIWISAVILAAGRSRRMGKFKLLLPFNGKSIIEQVVSTVQKSSVSEIVLVSGYLSEDVVRAVDTSAVKVIINPIYNRGMGSSLACGAKNCDPRARWLLIVLGDQPIISSETIDILIKTAARARKGIIVPTYRGRRGHPILFDIKYRDILFNLHGDTGAREVIQQKFWDITEVAIDSPGVLVDIDTPEDYRKLNDGAC